ncbi:hypothetical protein [Rhizohabitans arisaemae]|uniref:hypothetical protein n=1 Tax=Rhizohabitans arisaemae TaxID=2720610 RepID=UPI0024B19F8C|nr:hypothetical protein [Rhizohabitans arisaemae]
MTLTTALTRLPVLSIVICLSALMVGTAPTGPAIRERWRSWPVDRIFPEAIPGVTRSGATATYLRAGIAAEAPCRTALQPPVARLLGRLGCVSVLRATYADSTQTYVVTTGIVVLAEGTNVPLPRRQRPGDRPSTVRPVAFRGGPADEFTEKHYVTGGVAGGSQRYLVLTAAGYADSRLYSPADRADLRLSDVADTLATALYRRITAPC